MAVQSYVAAMLCAFALGSLGCSPTQTDASSTPHSKQEPNNPPQSKANPSEIADRNYGALTIDSVVQSGMSATISGTTDLPDGAVLSSGVELYNADPKSTYIGNEADAIVRGGKWSATVAFPKVSDFAKGPYEATAMFTPKTQNPEIVSLVGDDGQHLRGRCVSNKMGFNVIDVSKRIQLSVAKRRNEMPDLHSFAATDPRRQVAVLLSNWRNERWDAIARNSIFAEPSSIEERRRKVDNWLAIMKLEDARIESCDSNGTLAKVNVHYTAAFGSDLKEDTIGFVVLRVDANGLGSESGSWRVNLNAITNGGFSGDE